MGWLFGYGSYQELKRHLLVPDKNYKIIDYKSTKFCRHLWVAYEEIKTGNTHIVLYLISKDCHGWGYKSICESMGPCEIDCPISLLKKTSGFNHEYSIEWRKKVLALHKEKEKAKNVSAGDIVYVYGKEFKLIGKSKRSWIGIEVETGYRYRLPKDGIRVKETEQDFLSPKKEENSLSANGGQDEKVIENSTQAEEPAGYIQ